MSVLLVEEASPALEIKKSVRSPLVSVSSGLDNPLGSSSRPSVHILRSDTAQHIEKCGSSLFGSSPLSSWPSLSSLSSSLYVPPQLFASLQSLLPDEYEKIGKTTHIMLENRIFIKIFYSNTVLPLLHPFYS
jgi:hypothetical protein